MHSATHHTKALRPLGVSLVLFDVVHEHDDLAVLGLIPPFVPLGLVAILRLRNGTVGEDTDSLRRGKAELAHAIDNLPLAAQVHEHGKSIYIAGHDLDAVDPQNVVSRGQNGFPVALVFFQELLRDVMGGDGRRVLGEVLREPEQRLQRVVGAHDEAASLQT